MFKNKNTYKNVFDCYKKLQISQLPSYLVAPVQYFLEIIIINVHKTWFDIEKHLRKSIYKTTRALLTVWLDVGCLRTNLRGVKTVVLF